jgi:hypothetical protein
MMISASASMMTMAFSVAKTSHCHGQIPYD